MINSFNEEINNIWKSILWLVLPFTLLVLISKITLILITKNQKKPNKENLIHKINLIFEVKFLPLILEFLIITLNQTIIDNLWNQLIPVLSVILILQVIISFQFLIKISQENKLKNNFGFIIFAVIIFSQFMIISWKLHNLLFTSFNNFIFISTIYSIFSISIYKFFNENLVVIKYLMKKSCDILINKKNDKLNEIQKSLTIYSKTTIITNLWNFTDWKNIQNDETNLLGKDKKNIKNQIILFVIASINTARKNIIKLQKIIINGWKLSLIE